MILCDIGNSSFHFYQNGKSFKLSVNDSLKTTKFKAPIYFISVNKLATKKLLKKYPNATNIQYLFNLQTKYSSSIGIDRVVASSYIKNAIVVDFGSAITVDVIKNYKHKGGFILPGVDILKQTYPNISKKLKFHFENNINLDKMPNNTNIAINYAITQMIILPIKNVQKKYNLNIIFTGENSKVFLKYFKNYKFEENLIFKNMLKAVQEKK